MGRSAGAAVPFVNDDLGDEGRRVRQSEDDFGRIKGALAELLADRAYDEIDLDEVLMRAGVDDDAFHRQWADLDDCLRAIWRMAEEEFVAATANAFVGSQSWRAGMRATAWALCRFLQEDHPRARILLLNLNAEEREVRAERDQLMRLCVDVVHNGRFETDDPDGVSRDIAAGITTMIWERAKGRARSGGFDQMAGEVPDMIYITMLPYVGRRAAEEELERARADLEVYRLP